MDLVRAAATLAALFGLVACGRSGAPQPAAAPAGTTPAFLNQAAGVRYVGGDACRPCHAETWATFERTGMGRSWYRLAAAPPLEDWTTRNAFEVRATGLRYRMFRRDGTFFMRQSVADGRGGEVGVDERELTWVVGSAHHSRTYLVEDGGKLFQAPACWYTRDAVWDLCPGYEFKNDYFSREIGRTCVFCHNGRMELLPGARNAYAEPLPHGIDCERCHGPGQLHVERWARGETPTGQGDSAIVNPRRLTAELRMQICFQCHMGDSKATERVGRYDAALEGWRPGRPITDAMLPYRFSEATPHDYGLSAQADRLLLSRCFRASGGRLECVTCHDPHVTVYRKDRPADVFDAKCLGCHAASACKAPAAERGGTSPPDDCVACHMRKAEPDDHRHAVFTDHWIRARIDEPPAPRARFEVEPYAAAAVEALAPEDRAFYEARAISLRAHAVPAEVQSGMWPRAEAKFREAIAAGLATSDAYFFLGKALAAQGKHREAADAYASAYAKAPGDHDVAFAQGQSLMRQRRVEDAARVFEAMTREHPDSAAPYAELARAKVARAEYAGALELYRKALACEPWKGSLRVNAAMMLSALERHAEAIAEAGQALRLEPEAPAAWDAYATLLSRAGRAAEAAAAARRAKELARPSAGE